jgi:hypothetical protein
MQKGGSFHLYQMGPSDVDDQIMAGMCSPYGVFGIVNDEDHSFDPNVPGGASGHGWLKQWARAAGKIFDASATVAQQQSTDPATQLSIVPDGTPCIQATEEDEGGSGVSKENWKFGLVCLKNFGVEGESVLGGNVMTGHSIVIDPLNLSPQKAGLMIGYGLAAGGTLPTHGPYNALQIHDHLPVGVYQPRLQVNGHILWNGGSLNISDRRLKKDIVHLDSESCLDKIKKLKGVTFRWRENAYLEEKDTPLNVAHGVDQYGFIAQEVEETSPEMVTTRYKPDGSKGLKAVMTSDLFPLLVEAVKAQQEQIEALQEEVKNLKNS